MSSTQCPRCGKDATGNFCASCGASLGGRHCTRCGADVMPGARFCNECGTPIGAGAAPASGGAGDGGGGGVGAPAGAGAAPSSAAGGQVGWWIGGAALVVAIFAVAWPVVRPDSGAVPPPPPTGATSTAGQGPGAVDLTSMSPREAADRLFDRVMVAAENGDSATVATFLPMSIQAYDRVEPLDADGVFHKGLLQVTGARFQEGLATAEAFLEEDPDHLLVLAVAARAAAELGQEEKANRYYEHLLEVWEAERPRARPEYELHASMFPALRQEAEEYVGR